jgi:hypothetical protein
MGLRDPVGLISLSKIYSAAPACRRCWTGLFDGLGKVVAKKP